MDPDGPKTFRIPNIAKKLASPQNISPEGFLHGPLWYLEGVDGLYEGGTAVPGGQGGWPAAPHHQVLPREAATRHKRQVRFAEARLHINKNFTNLC
jgi:hypothetical protein